MNSSDDNAIPEASAAEAASTPSFKHLDHDLPIVKTQGSLPHWEQEGCIYFVTYRLADSMPAEKRRQWQAELDSWLHFHPKPWDEATWKEYHRTFEGEIQRWLDAGHGSCALRDPSIRKIVEDSFKHFDGQRYLLGDYVIMPNHVLLTPLPGFEMKSIVNAWKKFTGHAILRALDQPPPFWLHESYDHIVRSERQLAHYQNYIRENPAKAFLKPGEWTHYSAATQ